MSDIEMIRETLDDLFEEARISYYSENDFSAEYNKALEALTRLEQKEQNSPATSSAAIGSGTNASLRLQAEPCDDAERGELTCKENSDIRTRSDEHVNKNANIEHVQPQGEALEALNLIAEIDVCDPINNKYFQDYQTKIDAAVETIRAALTRGDCAVGDGFTIVPIEPTEEMNMAAQVISLPEESFNYDGSRNCGHSSYQIYKAMLQNSPKIDRAIDRGEIFDNLNIFNSMVKSLKGHEKAKQHIRKVLSAAPKVESWWRPDTRLSDAENLLLRLLIKKPTVSKKELAKNMGKTPRTIHRLTKSLRDKAFIKINTNYDGVLRTINTYKVLPTPPKTEGE